MPFWRWESGFSSRSKSRRPEILSADISLKSMSNMWWVVFLFLPLEVRATALKERRGNYLWFCLITCHLSTSLHLISVGLNAANPPQLLAYITSRR